MELNFAMSDRVVTAVKFTVLGAACGTVVAAGGDAVFGTLVPLLSAGTGSSADNLGRAAMALVASSATVAVGLYAGDRMMEYLDAADDPLAGFVFFYTACSQMQTFSVAPRIFRGWINQMTMPAATSVRASHTEAVKEADDSPPIGPRDLAVNMTRKPACMSGNCGGLNFN